MGGRYGACLVLDDLLEWVFALYLPQARSDLGGVERCFGVGDFLLYGLVFHDLCVSGLSRGVTDIFLRLYPRRMQYRVRCVRGQSERYRVQYRTLLLLARIFGLDGVEVRQTRLYFRKSTAFE